MSANKGKVLVAMSGGVDSSVAAALLQREGYEVVGCFMRLGNPGETLEQLLPPDADDDAEAGEACAAGGAAGGGGKVKIGHQGCCSINDAKDAQHVAAKLDIPLYVMNFKRDFGRIIDYFLDEYDAGRTPNPCVRCNDWLKFGKLADYARSIDADYVATGHYARIEHTPDGEARLLRGVDERKDQSYVLFGQGVGRLERMLLPVGAYRKDRIRELARELDLPVFDKPDSQEICFVPDMDYAGLIRKKRPDAMSPGEILDLEGNHVGEHAGHQQFTIGQRRGVGVALGYPIYVVDKDPQANTITVGPGEKLLATACTADQTNWLAEPLAVGDARPCRAKIRYNHGGVDAIVERTGDDELRITFDQPQRAVAPGQAVVCYDGDRVLGGGWIREAEAAE